MTSRAEAKGGGWQAVVWLGTGIPSWRGTVFTARATAEKDMRSFERWLAGATVDELRDEERKERIDAWNGRQSDLRRRLNNADALDALALARVRERVGGGAKVVPLRQGWPITTGETG